MMAIKRSTYLRHFRRFKHLLCCILATGYAAPTIANEDTDTLGSEPSQFESIQLNVSPVTCVALHKRQICHKTIRLSWSTLPVGRYCIHASDKPAALKCWQHNAIKGLAVNYGSAKKVRYELREKNSDAPLAYAVVRTSWVYRTGQRSSSGWRLF